MNWFMHLQHWVGSEEAPLLWWQMSIRGVIVFFFGLALIRLLGRRAFGELTPVDIVIAILIGSNLSRTITGNAPLLPTLAATALVMLLYWLLIHAAVRSRWISRWFKGRPVHLSRDGQLDPRMMRRTGVGHGDIEESARRSGLDDAGKIQQAVLERSGKISVVPKSDRNE